MLKSLRFIATQTTSGAVARCCGAPTLMAVLWAQASLQ